jgi:hypothetical protein
MRISLFGNLRISFAGRPVKSVNTNRLHSLIAYLVLHGDTPQPRERLAFILWPASSESQARTNLRQLLHHLKRASPAECNVLVTKHFSVSVAAGPSLYDRCRRFPGGDCPSRLRANGGRGPHSGDVSGQLRSLGGHQSEVRSRELLPRKSKHPASGEGPCVTMHLDYK